VEGRNARNKERKKGLKRGRINKRPEELPSRVNAVILLTFSL